MSMNGNEGDHEEIYRPGEPMPAEVQCLFLVVIDLNGQSRVVLDPAAHFTAQRLANASDVYPSLANALADYQAIKTAEAILSFQAQIAHQMAEQTEAAPGDANRGPDLDHQPL